MDITNRIKKVIEYYDMNNSMFERKCGLSNGYVRKLKGNIGNEKLNQIFKAFPEINPEWMVYGTGEMTIKSSTKVEETISVNNATETNLIPIYDLDFCCGDMRRETNEEHIIGGLSQQFIQLDKSVYVKFAS